MCGFRERERGGELVSPGVLVPLKFEPQVMGQIVGPLKTGR